MFILYPLLEIDSKTTGICQLSIKYADQVN